MKLDVHMGRDCGHFGKKWTFMKICQNFVDFSGSQKTCTRVRYPLSESNLRFISCVPRFRSVANFIFFIFFRSSIPIFSVTEQVGGGISNRGSVKQNFSARIYAILSNFAFKLFCTDRLWIGGLNLSMWN